MEAYVAGLGPPPTATATATAEGLPENLSKSADASNKVGSGDNISSTNKQNIDIVDETKKITTALVGEEREGEESCSDGGASNRWAMAPVARKALYCSLQAGVLAHLPLKERLAAEVPWVKVK